MIHKYTNTQIHRYKTVVLGMLFSITPLYAADGLNLDWENSIDLSTTGMISGALSPLKEFVQGSFALIQKDPIASSTTLATITTMVAPSATVIPLTYGLAYGVTNGLSTGVVDGVTKPIINGLEKSVDQLGKVGDTFTKTLDKTATSLAKAEEDLARTFRSGNVTLRKTGKDINNMIKDQQQEFTKSAKTVTRECLLEAVSFSGKTLIQTLAYGSCIGVGAALMYKHLSNYTGKKSAILAGIGGAMIVIPVWLAHKTLQVPPAKDTNPVRGHARRLSI